MDDIDYHFNKVKCRKIEGLMPRLMGMVESEMEGMNPEAKIEGGVDKKSGKKFYTLYYEG